MKKITSILASLVIAVFVNNIHSFAAAIPPVVSEDGVVLMDATTGDIIFSKNMDAAYPPASTTKIMTILLTLELSKLDTVVTVGKNPPKIAAGTSNVSLVEGEQLTVKDLLYGLILQSGNDCAETLAEHLGATTSNFASMMNKRAKELGCTNTNFVNPSGLYNANHKTSAKHLALIMRELSKHPEFKEISTSLYYVIPPNNKYPKGHPMSNENKILTRRDHAVPGYEGSKTGWTSESLYSFIAVASRNGQKLIVSLVHGKSPTFYSDTQNLFNYGFNNFELVPLYSKGDKVLDYKVTNDLSIPLVAADNYSYVREKGSKLVPAYTFLPVDYKNKSINIGDKMLSLDFTLGDKSLVPLNLNSKIAHTIKAPILTTLTDSKPSNGKFYVALILCVLIFILVVYVALVIKSKHFRRKRFRRYQKYR